MGYVTEDEARPGGVAGRAGRRRTRGARSGPLVRPRGLARPQGHPASGRLEALGPIVSDDPLLLSWSGRRGPARPYRGPPGWCDRRLLARIHRYTLDRLRKEIEPVTAAISAVPRLLAARRSRSTGSKGRAASRMCSPARGFRGSAPAWEASVLPARVRGYRREWLDQLTLSGEVTWGRMWGAGLATPRRTPITLVLRQDLEQWSDLAATVTRPDLPEEASAVHDALVARGAMFAQELARATRLPAMSVETALAALVALGRVTCDSYGGLRWLLVPAWRRRSANLSAGRWSVLRPEPAAEAIGGVRGPAAPEADRRGLPPDPGQGATARALARRRAGLPADGGPRRDPRRAVRGRIRRRAVRAGGCGHSAARGAAPGPRGSAGHARHPRRRSARHPLTPAPPPRMVVDRPEPALFQSAS